MEAGKSHPLHQSNSALRNRSNSLEANSQPGQPFKPNNSDTGGPIGAIKPEPVASVALHAQSRSLQGRAADAPSNVATNSKMLQKYASLEN